MQLYGLAKTVDQPKASGGKALDTFGSETYFHEISWKIEVPKSGLYKLKVRYAADQPKVVLNILIDGKVSGDAFERATLYGPKGWGSERYWKVNNYNWLEMFTEDGTGKLLLLPLIEGSHEIALSRASSGLILDSFELVGAK